MWGDNSKVRTAESLLELCKKQRNDLIAGLKSKSSYGELLTRLEIYGVEQQINILELVLK